MEQTKQVIPYKSVPRWLFPTVAMSCGIGAAVLLLMHISLALLICPSWAGAHASLLVLETFVRGVALLVLSFCAFVTFEIARNDQLTFSPKGLSFPLFLAPSLLLRRTREWEDIGNILVGAMLLEDKKGKYESELEDVQRKNKVFIYFKSGGHVTLDLSKMPKDGREYLFKAVEKWCIECHRVPQSRDSKSQKKSEKQAAKPITQYTQIWEEELQAHFSATNFVPLDKGSSLQGGKFTVLMQLSS
ncbi:MAG: hypothetical protein ACRD3W_27770, partial [Terriglobales bacterium]